MENEHDPNTDSAPLLPDERDAAREESDGRTDENATGASSSLRERFAPTRHRQYLRDRCDGKSKIGGARPPLRSCLPPPCVKWCPYVFEQNPVCEFSGGFGLIAPGNARWRRILCYVGLASNVIGFCLTIVACCSISLHYDTLMRTAFSSGRTVSDNPNIPGVEIGIGLRGIAFRRPILNRNTVWTFDQFCYKGFKTGTVQYFGDGVCHGCADTSAGLVGTLIVSAITYLPSFFTDILRMYPNYDVNCQKAFASFVTLASMIMSIYTWVGYMESCFSVFYDGVVPYNMQGEAISPEDFRAMSDVEKRLSILVRMDYEWKAGPGLICVVVATGLKLVDILCNMVLKTPTITRNRKEQEEYEALGVEDA